MKPKLPAMPWPFRSHAMNRSKPALLTTALLACSITALPAVTSVVNYWDFEGGYDDKVGPANGTAGADVSVITGHDGGTAAFFPTAITGGGGFNSTGYVDIAPQIPNVGGGSSAFSFSYWVRLDYDGTSNPRGIFDFSGNGSANDGPQSLYIQTGGNAGRIAFRVDGDDGIGTPNGTDNVVAFVDVSAFEGTAGSPTGSWIFLAGNFDPSTGVEVYLNGNATPAATASVNGTINSVDWNSDQYLGAFNVNGIATTRGLEGGLDDLAIYDDVLTTGQIADLFSGAITPDQIPEPSTGLLGLLGAAALLRRRR